MIENLEYNTVREDLIIPEYGRHIQKMINYASTRETKEERNKLANAIISVMGNLQPHLRDVADFQHKLWDQLFIMSDFKLDADSPFEKPSKEILNAKPTNIKTIPNVKAYSFEFNWVAITLKLVDPVKPYINEHPYNNKPEDKALKTKYFNPASEDLILSLLNVAKTYNANDCNSSPI